MKKGQKMTQEQKNHLSLVTKGKPKSEAFKLKCKERLLDKPSMFKGHKQSEKQKEIMRSMGGKNHYNYTGRCDGMSHSEYSIMLRREKKGFVGNLFENRLKEQNNKCAICDCDFDETIFMKKKSADHCHKKNIPRGILCRKCNLLLGNSEDNITILKNAIIYLNKWQK